MNHFVMTPEQAGQLHYDIILATRYIAETGDENPGNNPNPGERALLAAFEALLDGEGWRRVEVLHEGLREPFDILEWLEGTTAKTKKRTGQSRLVWLPPLLGERGLVTKAQVFAYLMGLTMPDRWHSVIERIEAQSGGADHG